MRRCIKGVFALVCLVAGGTSAWGWGNTGHKFVNHNAVIHLPASMAALTAQQSFLEAHASDADYRKSADTAEYPKHFLDLESYPDYRHLPPELATLIAQYGWTVVKTNGILPWATVWALDSMTAQLKRGDMSKAYQTAADLGHYVADAHQPLHCTVNYDGYQTGNNGIHSRYETKMIDAFQSSLFAVADTVHYVGDPYGLALSYILESNAYADSVMLADDSAKARSGWNGSGVAPQAYYDVLWEKTRHFTLALLQESNVDLASLWYTAWVDAGLAGGVSSVAMNDLPTVFWLEQNWPNPFNPFTTIKYTVGGAGGVGAGGQGSGPSDPVLRTEILDPEGRNRDSRSASGGPEPGARKTRLVVYDLLGRQVATLVDEAKAPGTYEVSFNASGLSSGVYLYRLTVGPSGQARTMVLLK